MNDRSAKIGVWAYLLFTLASFALALYLLLAEGGYRYNVSLVALPVWMGYTAFNTIKSVSRSHRRSEPNRQLHPYAGPLGGYL